MTNITAVVIMSDYLEPVELRMTQNSYSLNTSYNDTVINIIGGPKVSWMLWKTEFQINSYHINSSSKNFTRDINKIVSISPQETFHGTISENKYASGNTFVLLECYTDKCVFVSRFPFSVEYISFSFL